MLRCNVEEQNMERSVFNAVDKCSTTRLVQIGEPRLALFGCGSDKTTNSSKSKKCTSDLKMDVNSFEDQQLERSSYRDFDLTCDLFVDNVEERREIIRKNRSLERDALKAEISNLGTQIVYLQVCGESKGLIKLETACCALWRKFYESKMADLDDEIVDLELKIAKTDFKLVKQKLVKDLRFLQRNREGLLDLSSKCYYKPNEMTVVTDKVVRPRKEKVHFIEKARKPQINRGGGNERIGVSSGYINGTINYAKSAFPQNSFRAREEVRAMQMDEYQTNEEVAELRKLGDLNNKDELKKRNVVSIGELLAVKTEAQLGVVSKNEQLSEYGQMFESIEKSGWIDFLFMFVMMYQAPYKWLKSFVGLSLIDLVERPKFVIKNIVKDGLIDEKIVANLRNSFLSTDPSIFGLEFLSWMNGYLTIKFKRDNRRDAQVFHLKAKQYYRKSAINDAYKAAYSFVVKYAEVQDVEKLKAYMRYLKPNFERLKGDHFGGNIVVTKLGKVGFMWEDNGSYCMRTFNEPLELQSNFLSALIPEDLAETAALVKQTVRDGAEVMSDLKFTTSGLREWAGKFSTFKKTTRRAVLSTGLAGEMVDNALGHPANVCAMLYGFPKIGDTLHLTIWMSGFFEVLAPNYAYQMGLAGTVIVSVVREVLGCVYERQSAWDDAQKIVPSLLAILTTMIMPMAAISVSSGDLIKTVMGVNAMNNLVVSSGRSLNVIKTIVDKLFVLSGLIPDEDKLDPHLLQIQKKIDDYSQKLLVNDYLFVTSEGVIDEIKKMKKEVDEAHVGYRGDQKSSNALYCNQLRRDVEKLYEAVNNIAQLKKVRHMPVMVNFWGPGGHGKSYLAETLTKKFAKEMKTTVGTVSLSSKYFNGYDEDGTVYMDDVFNTVKDQEFAHLFLTMVSTIPLPAEQAACEGKKMPFRPRLIVSTSNEQCWSKTGVIDNDALLSRRELNIEVFNPKANPHNRAEGDFSQIVYTLSCKYPAGSPHAKINGKNITHYTFHGTELVPHTTPEITHVTMDQIEAYIRARLKIEHERWKIRLVDQEQQRKELLEHRVQAGPFDAMNFLLKKTGFQTSPVRYPATWHTASGRLVSVFTVCGRTGTRKTHLLNETVEKLKEKVELYTAADFDKLLSKVTSSDTTFEKVVQLDDFGENPAVDKARADQIDDFVFRYYEKMAEKGARLILVSTNYINDNYREGVVRRRGRIIETKSVGQYSFDGSSSIDLVSAVNAIIKEFNDSSKCSIQIAYDVIGDDLFDYLCLPKKLVESIEEDMTDIEILAMSAPYMLASELEYPYGTNPEDFRPLLRCFSRRLWLGSVEESFRKVTNASLDALPEGAWKIAVMDGEENEPFILTKRGTEVKVTLRSTVLKVACHEDRITINRVTLKAYEWLEKQLNGEDITKGLQPYDIALVESKLLLAKPPKEKLTSRFLRTMTPTLMWLRKWLSDNRVKYALLAGAATMAGISVSSVIKHYLEKPKEIPAQVVDLGGRKRLVLDDVPMAGDTLKLNGKSINVVEQTTGKQIMEVSQEDLDMATQFGQIEIQSMAPKERAPKQVFRGKPLERQSECFMNDGVIKKAIENQISIVTTVGAIARHVVYGLLLGGREFISVNHAFTEGETLYVRHNGGFAAVRVVSRCSDRDLLFGEIDDVTFPAAKDIRHLFLSDDDLQSTRDFFGFVPVRGQYGPIRAQMLPTFRAEGKMFRSYDEQNVNCFVVSHMQLSVSLFKKGDCGLVYMAHVNGQSRIAGIHYASQGLKSFGVVVTNDILAPLVRQGGDKPIFIPHGIVQRIGYLEGNHDFGNYRIMGTVRPLHCNTKSKIVKLATYDKIYKSEMLPAILNKEMLYKKVREYAPKTKNFPQFLVDEVVEEMIDGLSDLVPELFILSEHQTLNGLEKLPRVDKATSLGYAFAPLTNKEGKHEVIKDDNGTVRWRETELAKSVRTFFYELVDSARKGDRVATFVSFTLKDETRHYKKVVENPNTRLFQANPVDLVLFSRMVIGSFIDAILRNPDLSACCVGVDPNSFGWDCIYLNAVEKGNEGFDGDFSNFDSAQKSQLMEAAFKIFKSLALMAGWSTGELNMIDVLQDNIINTYLICDKFILEKSCGNPSGWAGTTILNSLVNEMMMLIVWKILCMENGIADRTRNAYRRGNFLAVFGDDNFVIPDPKTPWYNHTAVSRVFAKYDIKYTTSSKDAGESGDNKPLIGGISFLKRTFAIRNGMMCAPLNLGSILERFNWSKKGITQSELEVGLNELFLDLCLHDKETYDSIAERFRCYLDSNRYYVSFRPVSFECANNMMIRRKFETIEGNLEPFGTHQVLYHIGMGTGWGYRVDFFAEDGHPGDLCLNARYYIDEIPPVTLEDLTVEGGQKSEKQQFMYDIMNLKSLEESLPERSEKYELQAGPNDSETRETAARIEVADTLTTTFRNVNPELGQMTRKPLIPERAITDSYNFVTTVNYTTTSPTGSVLYATKLMPNAFPGTYLEYLSQICLYFVGSFEFHMSLVSTYYHAGKLIFVHIPDPNFVPTTQSLAFYTQFENKQIVDIKEHQCIEFSIPYESTQRALYMNSAVPEFANPGWFLIIAYSPLSAIDSVSPIVPINIMVRPTSGCHFLALKNVPSVALGGVGADGASVKSSLLAPTPLYAPNNSGVHNLTEVQPGNSTGAYDYWQATNRVGTMLERGINYILGTQAASPAVLTFPIVRKNGTIIQAPMDSDLFHNNGTARCGEYFWSATGGSVTTLTNVSSSNIALFMNAVTASDRVYKSVAAGPGFVGMKKAWDGRPVWIVGQRFLYEYWQGGSLVEVVSGPVSIFTDYPLNNYLYMQITFGDTSILTNSASFILVQQLDTTSTLKLDPGTVYDQYIQGVRDIQNAISTTGGNGIVYSKYALPDPNGVSEASFNQTIVKATPYTGAVVDAVTKAEEPQSWWETALYGVQKVAGYVGKILQAGETIASVLLPLIRLDNPLVFRLNGTDNFKYDLYEPSVSTFTLATLQTYLDTTPSIVDASEAARLASIEPPLYDAFTVAPELLNS